MLAGAPSSQQRPQRYKILFVSVGSSPLDRNFTKLEIRRANILIQLMTILEENRHIVMIVEHDPMLYEDSGHKVEYEIQGPDADLQGGDHLALPPKLDLRLQR